ncbi:ATP-dependent RNA helicase HrpA [Microlunatus ginsengisoli]|uniref:ATP-dependent RNA helicase HrpA n=1 Tax=Microlunatus ginsengisoli TaxID=363863 RepID=A0ABP6ZLB4_9ACTN
MQTARTQPARTQPAPVLEISYDEALPITAWHDEIAEAIRDNPVVIVAGETGSGKTTQLPKICLELGRRSIGHTQPRRIAARTVAERVAEELKVEIGDLVGYQVRFTRRAGRDTRLKIMTDGVLLAEIAHDRDLRRYDTIIIDEAHERSLNIDFLLGYLKQLLSRRRDLKIIVTSATIDTERFAAHFADTEEHPAPIIEVSGRTYPVEVRYRPLLVDGEADQLKGITDAVAELSALGNGDILVFLSGEREIRDTAEAINGLQLRFTEVLPLYARLSAAEQHRVFQSHPGRRIVLSTNVAETSLTVPGIRYVIDAGTARISRYSARTKVQRLPIEPISQASANQRAGRCGRLAPGVAIRLYDEEDFLGRPEFTEPEILRTNLAAVILQMAAADLGDIASFPFVEAPDRTQITDGIRLLEELGALKGGSDRDHPRLSAIGRRLAAIPVDPRMGRMLLAAERQGCLREMSIIVAGLSIQDPRERPAEHREKADQLHRRFWAPMGEEESGRENAPADGDFMALLRMWEYVRDAQHRLSGNAFRRLCRDEFLHFLRIREWQDLHAQLREIGKDLGLNRNTEPAGPERIHTAALAGLLSHVGLADLRDERPRPGTPQTGGRRRRAPIREYLGSRGTRFAINPGSSLARVQPPLVMAAEIVETTRLWARTVAGIDATQVEEVGAHLLKRSYSEPHWSSRSGAVLAYEQVTLYGIPIVAGRRVGYAKINPAEARDIFIRSALVEGRWRTRHRFFARNAEVRAEAEQLEEKARRRDLTVDDEVIFDFYAARIPADVTGAVPFDNWWKHARQQTPELLDLGLDDLLVGALTGADAFPSSWLIDDHELTVRYVFDPGSDADGVSVVLPLALLNQLEPAPFSWQVPGLRRELATELIKTLPKEVRRQLVPAAEFAGRALDWLHDHPAGAHPAGGTEDLPTALGRAIRGLTGQSATGWQPADVPRHLQVRFEVTAADGAVVASGRDLAQLKDKLAGQVRESLTLAGAELARSGATGWVFGTIGDQLELDRGGRRLVGYPALVDEGTAVGLRVLETPERQDVAHVAGLRRLVLLNTPDPTRWVVGHLSNVDKLALGHSPYPGVPALLADARLASVGELIERAGGTSVRTEAAFVALCDTVRVDNAELMRSMVNLTAEILRLHQQLLAELPAVAAVDASAAADVTEQVGNLVFAGFLAATRYRHLVDLPRYLSAARQRLVGLRTAPGRERAGYQVIARCEDAYAQLCDLAPPGRLPEPVEEIGWLLEELRVSLFAQSLRTKVSVSEKRVLNAIAGARPSVA